MAFMWHGPLLAVNWATNVWSSSSMQILVLLSLAVQFALTISAAFRWRGASWVRKFVVWSMYVVGDYLATTALSKLSVSTTSGVHQLVALWASILLLHLGGPDNISAYSLEDNELSKRKMMEWILRVLGAAYVTISISGSRKLVVAARWILFVLGFFKYLEKAIALRRANLGNMRKSVMKERRAECVKGSYKPGLKLQWDDKHLQIAHSLFHICKRAMVDSSSKLDVKQIEECKTLIDLRGKDTCKVMEMELSLMYDILYTKASVIHTWHGYLIRVVSPIATLIALVLFELSNEAGWSGVDVWITRILLFSTVFLETVSLLSALESSWTVAYLYQRGWLEHAILCNGRWHRFRRWLVPLRRFVSAEGCREWSGTIGQHNMLRLCNRDMKDGLCRVEWCKDEHYYLTEKNAHPVKELVFEALRELLWVVDTQDEGSDSESEHSTIQNTGAVCADADPRNTQHPEGPQDEGSDSESEHSTIQISDSESEHSTIQISDSESEHSTNTQHPEGPQDEGSDSESEHSTIQISDSESEHSTIQNTGAVCADADPRNTQHPEGPVPTSLSADADPMYTVDPEARVNSLGMLKAEMGRRALNKLRKALINQEDAVVPVPLERYIRDEIHEGILIWHIATDVYLHHSHAEKKDPNTTRAIKVLSNYMMFLLVEHPYMLPGLVVRTLYEVTCKDLANIWEKCGTVSNRAHQHNDLARTMDGLKRLKDSLFVKELEGRGLVLASELAKELLRLEKLKYINGVLNPVLKLVFDVWVEMLLYASHRSSRESHAKKLSTVRSGAELATVVWLFAEHAALYPVNKDGIKKRNKLSTYAHSKFSTEEA